MTARNQKIERRNAQLEEQLKSFYSPLIGMKSEVRARVALRRKVHDVAAAEWQKLFKGVDDPSQRKAIEDAKWPAYERLHADTETRVRDELIPVYNRALSHFSTNMWLAEESTREHYSALTEYVELWNRHLRGAIPPEVVRAIDSGEVALEPLYADLTDNFDRLTRQLRK